jgi:hypothetical protein
MRGKDEQQLDVFSYISPEQRVPQDHPLRSLRAMTDKALRQLQPRFSRLYAKTGRRSVAPEKLLRALLLQALYSVRSERMLMAREAEQCGAGEILLTSMDRDGTCAGFDCDLTRAVAEALHIPVIASGGGGDTQSFINVFQRGRADAALAASIFHFGLHTLAFLKQELQGTGIPVRWPC